MASGFKIASIYADLSVDSKNLDRGLANARKAIEMCAAEIATLRAAARGPMPSIVPTDAAARIRELRATMLELTRQMQGAYAQAKTTNGGLSVMAQGMGKGAGGAQNFGYALTQLSSVVDDAQYGIQACVNNIGPLALGLSGGNAAVAGAAQIAAVAIAQLIHHWDDLAEAFGSTNISKSAKAQIDEIAEAAANATENLAGLKAHETEVDRITKKLDQGTEKQQKDEKAWQDAFTEDSTGRMGATIAAQLGDYQSTEPEKERVRKAVRAVNPLLTAAAGVAYVGAGFSANNPLRNKLRDLEDQAIVEYEQKQAAMRTKNLIAEAAGHGPNAEAARMQIEAMMAKNPELYTDEQRANIARARTGKTKKEEEAEKKQAATKKDQDEKKKQHDEDAFEQQAKQDIAKGATPFAVGFAKGDLGKKLRAGEGITEADVRRQMLGAGATENQINALAGEVLKKLRTSVKNQVDKFAVERGISQKEAGTQLNEKDTIEKELKQMHRDDAVSNARIGVRRSQEAIDDYWKEKNKPKFMGFEDYFQKLSVGGFTAEEDAKKLVRLGEDAAKARQQLNETLLQLKLQGFAVGP